MTGGDVLLLIAGISILILCFNLLVLYLYRSIAKITAIMCRYEDLQRYCKHMDDLLRSEDKRLDTIHDYLRNLGVIAALIEQNCPSDAADYIYRLEESIKRIHVVKYTGNREVDAILSSKLPLMKAKGISCAVDGILPATLPFDFLDVCALLSNALDNAIEASIRQGMAGETISLHVSYQHGFFMVRLTNVISGEHPMRARRQGRGLAIMREIVDKYEGTMSLTVSDGRFVLSALLQEPDQSR